jgi:hypothetical protein
MMDALPTGRKHLNLGYKGEVQCIFCRYGIEDGDHHFVCVCMCGFNS